MAQHYSISEALRLYHLNNYSTTYTVGFIYNKKVYAISLPHVLTSWVKAEYNKKKDRYNYRLRLNASTKRAIIKQEGCICLGYADDLFTENDKYNHGDQFERIIYEAMTGKEWEKDFTEWWNGADIEVAGAKIQVKFNGATIVKENQLHRYA